MLLGFFYKSTFFSILNKKINPTHTQTHTQLGTISAVALLMLKANDANTEPGRSYSLKPASALQSGSFPANPGRRTNESQRSCRSCSIRATISKVTLLALYISRVPPCTLAVACLWSEACCAPRCLRQSLTLGSSIFELFILPLPSRLTPRCTKNTHTALQGVQEESMRRVPNNRPYIIIYPFVTDCLYVLYSVPWNNVPFPFIFFFLCLFELLLGSAFQSKTPECIPPPFSNERSNVVSCSRETQIDLNCTTALKDLFVQVSPPPSAAFLFA